MRWAKILRELGWKVRVGEEWGGERAALVVALHARKSRESIVQASSERARPQLVVALTGTDVYGEAGGSGIDAELLATLRRADRILALQEHAAEGLPAGLSARTRVIHQSLPVPRCARLRREDRFEVAVIAHFRSVKDPLLAARAVRRLPESSRVHVLHAGEALDDELGRAAARETRTNARYTWLGALPRSRALQLLANSRLCLSTSRAEGGPNVLSEALALDVPALATRIPGHVGLLGEGHPGLFEVGDAAGLAALLARAESEPGFLDALAAACRARAWIVERPREREAWRGLLAELFAEHAEGAP